MIVANGSTDVTTYFVLRDSTNHAPKMDVTVTDIDLYYVEELAAISAKADATALAAADSAHSDNKAYHVGQGLYRIDWPDAAFDAGIGKKVILIVACTGVDTTFLEIELSPAADVRAFGGTAGTFSGGRPEVNTTHAAGTAWGSGAITAASIATGAIAAAKFAAGAIDAAAIATGAIDADAIAADAVNEIADQVWDEALSGHATGGSSGAALSAAGSAGDPWSTALPGAYGAGTAGKILGDNLNATVSSRASQTSVDTVDDLLDTEIAAIKAKTDLIPASPAAVGSAMTLASGAVDATALATDAAQEIADALLDRTAGVETGLTPRQFLRLAASILFAKASGQGTGTETYRDYGDTKDRLVATLAAGARTFGTRDAT